MCSSDLYSFLDRPMCLVHMADFAPSTNEYVKRVSIWSNMLLQLQENFAGLLHKFLFAQGIKQQVHGFRVFLQPKSLQVIKYPHSIYPLSCPNKPSHCLSNSIHSDKTALAHKSLNFSITFILPNNYFQLPTFKF